MEALRVCSEELIDQILTLATKVHMELGPGLLESVYEKALMFELTESGIAAECQVDVLVKYRNVELGLGFRADIVVDNSLLLELKTVNEFVPIHLAQLMTYLKVLKIKRGFLLNFNSRLLKHGIKRISI